MSWGHLDTLKERRGQAGHTARHARLDDPDDPRARANARVRHLAAAGGPQPRSVPRQSWIPVSFIVSAGTGRQAEGRMATYREQSPRQVLPPHSLGATATGTASGAVESRLIRRDQRVGGRMTLLHRL